MATRPLPGYFLVGSPTARSLCASGDVGVRDHRGSWLVLPVSAREFSCRHR